MSDPARLKTRNVKRIDREAFGDEVRHLQPQAECPSCGQWGDVDPDQLDGSVSLVCECGWHGFIDGRTA